MRNKRKNQLPVIPIGLSVCLLGIVTFLFLHFTSQNETTSGLPTPPVTDPLTPGETPAIWNPPPPTPGPTIGMTESSISIGSLVLVDSLHKFDKAESELDLVLVNEAKTVPFQMRSDYVTKLCRSVMEPLNKMMQAYIDEVGENTVYIYIGYRDEAAQQKTLDDFTAMLGREAALRRVALPGHSEHHTGLAMDLGALVDGVHHTFDYRESNHHAPTRWFAQNSYRFGFVLSFPEDRAEEGGSIYEPWHYRYVGYPHSHIMFENNWSLSEYLTQIRQYTQKSPLKAEYGSNSYTIFFTTDREIRFSLAELEVEYPDYINNPESFQDFMKPVSISGNNIDGFIVTIRK